MLSDRRRQSEKEWDDLKSGREKQCVVSADEQRTGPETASGEDFEMSKHDSIIDSISPPIE